jgi:AraC-like DNA-binding protein
VKHIAGLSRAYRRHVHDELAIAHVWDGSTMAWIQGRAVPISGPCVVFIAPGVAHACTPLLLDELCGLAGLSKYHLVRAFKAAFGLTPHAYQMNLRVNMAKARLKAGQELAGVALETGFCDQSHLTRVFCRCVGVTPAVYSGFTAIPSKKPARR